MPIVVTLDQAAEIATSFPEVTGGERFGAETPPAGPILAVVVEDLGEKQAVLDAGHRGFFTIPHFNGYAAVLIQLERVAKRALREAIEDAWLACAPAPLAERYLAAARRRR